jgi:2',3'-cyclic-nucleotide 2'-phosphodiesterase (5'-nucleotidase family)
MSFVRCRGFVSFPISLALSRCHSLTHTLTHTLARSPFWLVSRTGGFIRGDCVYEQGSSFTTGDLQRELPFPSSAAAIRIKGKDLRHAFEQQLKTLPNPSGSFPQLSGACLRYDPSRKPGHRVVDVNVYDRKSQQMQPLEEEREYTMACTTFMYGGGDGITALRSGVLISEVDVEVPVRDTVEAFLYGKPAISYGPDEVAKRSVIVLHNVDSV